MDTFTTFETMRDLGLLGWNALLVGWDRGWLAKSNVSDYAVACLRSGDADGNLATVTQLANAASMDEGAIRDSLVQLASVQVEDERFQLDKWRLARLVDLKSADLDWDAKVTCLEEIGAEFGFPPDMALCTRYGPSEQAVSAGLVAANLDKDPLDAMDRVIGDLKRQFGIE